MKIHNIRFGFATNSSSSHSIVFDPINYSLYSDSNDSESFGWNYFTLASKEAKDEYMTAMLLQNISDSYNKNGFSNIFADIIVKGLGLKELDLDEISIDHQSLINLPLEYGTNHISVEFFQEFYNYIMRDEIIIFGGNDNEEFDEYPQKKYDTSIAIVLNGILPKDTNASWVCRKDNDWWILYNKSNGARIIFSFLDNPEPFKPNTPILLDFKLTQFCDIGCQYCAVPGTNISTVVGDKKIEDIVPGDEVIVNDKGEIRTSYVKQVYNRYYSGELVEITVGDNIIRITPNHEVFTFNRGWIAAEYLTENDEIDILY